MHYRHCMMGTTYCDNYPNLIKVIMIKLGSEWEVGKWAIHIFYADNAFDDVSKEMLDFVQEFVNWSGE